MKWITRQEIRVDRVACPWLIKKFIDHDAQFFFVPADQVAAEAKKLGATPFDMIGAELGHHGSACSFEVFLEKYNLKDDPALVMLASIVNGAHVANASNAPAESGGLRAIAIGFLEIGLKDDHEVLARQAIVYDALYAYCREKMLEVMGDRL